MFTKDNAHKIIKWKIIELETQFDVDKWVVNGIFIWSYVRIKLYFLLLKNYDLEINYDKKDSHHIEKTNNKWILNLKTLFNIIVAFFRTELFFLGLKRKKIVFFGAHFHRVKHESYYFNRFFDSMVSYHQLENEVYMMEYKKVYQHNYNQKAIIPLESLLKDFKLSVKFKNKFKKQKKDYSLLNYDSFLSVLENEIENFETLNIATNDLVKWSIKIQDLSTFFKRFFLMVKPDKVIFLGYYGLDDLYAAIYAANVLQIKTIDFQHGTQSDVHMVFSSWTKNPKEGFNLMPQEYWSWDEKSKINIDNWTKNTSNVTAKVVGQPYLQYWKQKNNNLDYQNKVILYTLNLMPLREMFNESIGKTINESQCLWEIRLHPRNEFSMDEIKIYLDSLNVDRCKYHVHDSKELSLPEILSKTIIHITAFSGSLIEAKIMGIPSVIINILGKEIYKDYIDNELVYFLDQDNSTFNSDFSDIYTRINGKEFKIENNDIVNPVLI